MYDIPVTYCYLLTSFWKDNPSMQAHSWCPVSPKLRSQLLTCITRVSSDQQQHVITEAAEPNSGLSTNFPIQ